MFSKICTINVWALRSNQGCRITTGFQVRTASTLRHGKCVHTDIQSLLECLGVVEEWCDPQKSLYVLHDGNGVVAEFLPIYNQDLNGRWNNKGFRANFINPWMLQQNWADQILSPHTTEDNSLKFWQSEYTFPSHPTNQPTNPKGTRF